MIGDRNAPAQRPEVASARCRGGEDIALPRHVVGTPQGVLRDQVKVAVASLEDSRILARVLGMAGNH